MSSPHQSHVTPEAPPIAAAARVEVDLEAIRHNIRLLIDRAAPATVLGVVKADAYGHGARQVANVLVEEGVEQLAVATLSEAADLRASGVTAPLLVFAAPLPESLSAYARLQLGVTVSSSQVADAVIEAAQAFGPLVCHVKVDTGMHRLGFAPEAVADALRRLNAAPGVHVASLWTHLATADGDLAYAHEQLDRFDALVADLGPLAPPVVHSANGPMLLRMPERAAREGTIVRAGGVMYGLASGDPLIPSMRELGLRPALRFTSRVVHVQRVQKGESVSYGRSWIAPEAVDIATVAAGYADGVPRSLSSAGFVGIGGVLHPIVGRVCMDMMMVAIQRPAGSGEVASPASGVTVGDEVVIVGRGGLTAEDLAAHAGTISYELTCGISPRVARSWR